MIVGFKTAPEAGVEELARTERVPLSFHDIIYDVYNGV